MLTKDIFSINDLSCFLSVKKNSLMCYFFGLKSKWQFQKNFDVDIFPNDKRYIYSLFSFDHHLFLFCLNPGSVSKLPYTIKNDTSPMTRLFL